MTLKENIVVKRKYYQQLRQNFSQNPCNPTGFSITQNRSNCWTVTSYPKHFGKNQSDSWNQLFYPKWLAKSLIRIDFLPLQKLLLRLLYLQEPFDDDHLLLI